jgi:nucleoside-diphosphate-sugar epimerase
MARWALTGAGGYIGRHLAIQLLDRGEAVRGLYHKSTPPERVEAISGNILEPDAVARLAKDADVVVHLAAFVHRRAGSKAQKAECTRLNVEGTRIVAEACRNARAFLIDVSTANVYPPRPEPAHEATPTEPRTLYGKTKLAAEQIVASEIARGLHGVIIRPAMVFGPNAPGNLPRLIRMVRRGIVPMLGDGENKKTMTSIGRLSRAITALGENQTVANGEVFNVGGLTLSMKEIIAIIADELETSARVVSVPAGPVRAVAKATDFVTRGLRLPSFAQMVDSVASSSELDDSKLAAFPRFQDSSASRSELREAIRSFSAS